MTATELNDALMAQFPPDQAARPVELRVNPREAGAFEGADGHLMPWSNGSTIATGWFGEFAVVLDEAVDVGAFILT